MCRRNHTCPVGKAHYEWQVPLDLEHGDPELIARALLAGDPEAHLQTVGHLPGIAGLARQLGFHEAADWLNDQRNRKTYAQRIFRGFAPEGE